MAKQIKINYVIQTTVVDVTEVIRVVKTEKIGDEVQVQRENLGWFVLFEGSRERLFFGTERPPYEKGDTVKITFERVQCQALPTTNPTTTPNQQ